MLDNWGNGRQVAEFGILVMLGGCLENITQSFVVYWYWRHLRESKSMAAVKVERDYFIVGTERLKLPTLQR